ncbi:DNA polymerase IV [Paractinoplanes lichenicola]|uniref:DNA polymerase IV n=1 Tax=Paractinoplanes lichenicola TaxID=2802976 RepID=A0ABS1VV61_9ACTN|nr:DNA polymerase IV [Actinoplanes lichenicola]MBL7258366.1 DNA polymerase IV [Actinoplanes lichenicola]
MRREASVAHVDLDAMFAAVEQRDKVSLRGRPVIVGGVAGRGVVATASYEARRYGARSAMPTAEARRRCPSGTAFLAPRFAAYRKTSEVVMALLGEVSPLVEQVSIDEAYVDLAAAGRHDLSLAGVTALAEQIRRSIADATGGVTASIGLGSSKLVAKIGSDLHKPDGLTVVAPGQEQAFLHALPVSRLPGVGPATMERLRRARVHTVGDLAGVALPDLIEMLGQAHGAGLYRLARADDDRPIMGEREAKSVSAEETFDVDLTDRVRLNAELDLLAARVGGRLRTGGLSARTITIKVRHYDFTTITRSATRAQPTDDPRLVAQFARRLLAEVDTSAGIRLLGVGASTLADFVQDDLFGTLSEAEPAALSGSPTGVGLGDLSGAVAGDLFIAVGESVSVAEIGPALGSASGVGVGAVAGSGAEDGVESAVGSRSDETFASGAGDLPGARVGDESTGGIGSASVGVSDEASGGEYAGDADLSRGGGLGSVEWRPGQDVRHERHGAGWVWGSGRGRVTVRFEGPNTPPGPVITFAVDDPALRPGDPPDWRLLDP